ncbi:MAG: hypothetical protein J1E78_00010 [Muribaculaceae bacterium]|nr:hypothetical protein [Muribaculaceae bacterium]
MNRKLLNGLIVAAVALGGVGTFTSCKDEDYTNDLILGQKDLTEQIQAIRSITDSQFKTNLETWLNNWTSNASAGGFSSYDEMVAAADAMYKIYQDIMENYPNISAETEKYITNLYDWMFNNEISKSDWYDLIFKVAQRATSININSVYNPALGSINLPVGLKSTILAAYKVSEDGVEDYNFPEDADMHLAGTLEWSPAIVEALGVVANVVEETKPITAGGYADYSEYEAGNLGGLYVNINPSSVDFTNDELYTISLVDSKGTEVLGSDNLTISANDDDFYFGIDTPYYEESTRTEGGVYHIAANLTEDVEALEYIDLSEAQDFLSDIKAAVKDKSISNIAYLGEQLYKALNNRFPAYALEVAWQENEVDQETGEAVGEITNSVKSAYDIAAAVVTPLSYATDIETLMGAAHLTGKYLPTFSPLSEYLESLNFEIELPTGMATIEYENNVLTITDADGTVLYSETMSGNTEEALATAIKAVNGDVEGLINGLNQFNAAVEPFQDMINRVKNSNKLHYADKLVEIYNKVAGKVNNVLANPNHYLQVAAIYSDGNGYYHHLSTNANDPVIAGDAIELFLTSYTGDVVVPAMYKCVAVTAIDGVAVKEAQDAGEMVNVVFPGYQQRVAVDLSGFAGKTVQLTYVSVDYHGVTSAQNYYVKVQ